MPFGETNYGNVAENVGGQREETSDLKPSRKPTEGSDIWQSRGQREIERTE